MNSHTENRRISMISTSFKEYYWTELEKYQVIHPIKHHYKTLMDGCAANISSKAIYATLPFMLRQIQSIQNIK